MTVKHSLVIPCYNEEGNIDAFFDEACRAMAGYTDAFELVFVRTARLPLSTGCMPPIPSGSSR